MIRGYDLDDVVFVLACGGDEEVESLESEIHNFLALEPLRTCASDSTCAKSSRLLLGCPFVRLEV